MIKSILKISAGVALVSVFAYVGQDTKTKPELLNTNYFHLVDFVGWNTSFPVLAHYHTDDVKVFGDGYSTVSMEEHETVLKKTIAQMPDAKIVQHFPNVARGEWTGVVGTIPSMNIKMATVAKWRNGRIAEEYLFNAQVPAAEAASLKPSAKPITSFDNMDDKALADAVDLQPGWSCTMDQVSGKRTVFFIKKVNGKEVDRLVFS